MKKRTLIYIGSIIILFFIWKNVMSFLNREPKKEIPVTPPTVKTVQSQIITKSPFQEQIYITGRVGSVQEVTVSTQGSGFITWVMGNMGDRVVAGQTLARIGDTYWLTENAIGTAALGLEWAQIGQNSTILSLAQAMNNAKLSFEKSQKDFEAAEKNAKETLALAERNASSLQLSPNAEWEIVSKAQLDLNNYITSQQKQLDAFESSYDNQLNNFQSFLTNVIDTADTLLGVSEQKNRENDSFEYLLSARDSAKKIIAEDFLRKLILYKNWTPKEDDSLIDRVIELQKVQWITNDLLTSVETVLLNTVTDATIFPISMLNTYRATIDAYQAQYSGISSGLVNFLNTAQTFLATYQNERLAREQAVTLAAQNAQNNLSQTKISTEINLRAAATGLEMSKNAYTTAQKAYDLGIQQSDQWVSVASIRLSDARVWAERLLVKAPFSGSIISRSVEIGALVSPGMNLFTIGDTSNLIVRADVSVDQRKFLNVGQEVSITTSKGLMKGKIAHIASGPDSQSRLFKIEVSITTLLPGITLGDIVQLALPWEVLAIDGTQKEYVVVPYSSLKNLWQELYVVYILTPKNGSEDVWIARERSVKIGYMNETSVTLSEGLELGERVVIIGTLNVEDGDTVQLISWNLFDPTTLTAPTSQKQTTALEPK